MGGVEHTEFSSNVRGQFYNTHSNFVKIYELNTGRKVQYITFPIQKIIGWVVLSEELTMGLGPISNGGHFGKCNGRNPQRGADRRSDRSLEKVNCRLRSSKHRKPRKIKAK
jgi:hypothetical protein